MGSGNAKPISAQALPGLPRKGNGVGNGAAVSPIDERVIVQVGEYVIKLEPQRASLSSRKRRLNPGVLAPITGLRATINNQASADVFDVVLPCKEVAEAHAHATKETSKRASIDPSSVAARSDSFQRQQSGASSVKSSRRNRKGRNFLLLDGLAPQALATVPGLLAFLEDALGRARDDLQPLEPGSGTPFSPSSSTAMVTRESSEASIFKVPGLRCKVLEEGYNFSVRATVEVGTPGSWSWSSYAVSLDVPCVQRGQSKALTIWRGDSGASGSSRGPASPTHKVTTTTTTVKMEPWLLRKKITVKTTVREVPGPDPNGSMAGGVGVGGSPESPLEKNLPPLLTLENWSSRRSSRSSSSSSAFGGANRNKERDLPPLLENAAQQAHLSDVPADVAAAFRKCDLDRSGDLNAFELAHAIAELYGFAPTQAQVEEVMAHGVPAVANRNERFDATFHALTLRQFAVAVVGSDTPSSGDPPSETMLTRDGTDHPLKEEEEEEKGEVKEDLEVEEEDEAFEELFYGRALGFRVTLHAESSALVVDRVMDPALEGRVRVGDRVFTVNGVPMGPVQRRHALQAKLATVPGRPVKIGFLRARVAAAAEHEGRDGGDGVGGDAGGAEEAKDSEAYDKSSSDLNKTRNNRQSQLIDAKNHNTTSPHRSRANRKGSYSGHPREVSHSPTTTATPSKHLPQEEEEDVNTSTAGPAPVVAPAAASCNSAAAFELACDGCNQWFVNTEVGVSIQDAEAMDNGWFCRNCRPEAAPPVHKSGNANVSPKFSAKKFFAKTSSAAAWRKTTPTKSPVAMKAKTSEARAAPPVADSSVSDDGFDVRNNFAAEIATSPIRSPSRQRSNNHSLVSTPPRGRRSLPPLSPLSPKVGTGDGGGSVVSSVDGSEPAAAPERDREDPTQQLGQMPLDEGPTQPLQSTQRSPAWFRGKMFSAARPQSAGALRPASAPATEPQTAIVAAARPQTAMVAAHSRVGNRSLAVQGRRPSAAAAQGAPVESSALVEFEALQRSQAEAMLQHAHYAQQARTHNLKSPLAHMTQFAPLPPGVSSQPFPRDFVLNFGDSTPGAAARSSSSFHPGMVVDQNSGVVLSVSPGGAADRANIRAGFTILEVGGVAVNSAEEVSDALFYFRRRSKVEKHGHAEPTVALLCLPGEARLPGLLAAASTGKAGAAPEELTPPQISRNTSAKQLAAVNQASPYAGLAGALSAQPTPGLGQKGARTRGNPPIDKHRNSRRY